MKKFNPLVSIIIPVYNGSNYMKEAIDSALNQTYDNIEVIVVNDGSKDNGATDKIAKSYGKKIRYFSKENGRVASALNYGIDRMEGAYFSWLSHDDVYLPFKIEKQIQKLAELDDENTILYSAYELIDKNSNKLSEVLPHNKISNFQLNTSLIPLFRGLIHGCSMLIPKKCFDKIGKFDEKLRSTQDYDLWFKFLKKYQIKYSPDILIQSRLHQEQDSKTIPNINDEANQLWIGFMNNLNEKSMIDMEGSIYAFFKSLEITLKNTPYQAAEKYASQKSEEYWGTPKISIIIPFYNRIDFTIDSINSALKQTYDNIEIILINDGSSENTKPIEEIVKKHNKIKYYEQKNKGVSAARNLGILKSTGEYIAFLDSDDVFHEQKLEKQLKKMIYDDCYISHTYYNKVDVERNFINIVKYSSLSGYVFKNIISSCPIATPAILLRKSILKDTKFREDIQIGEDTCIWLDVLFENKLSLVKEALVDVRIYSQTTINNQKKYFEGHLNIINHIVSTRKFEEYTPYIARLFVDTASIIDDKFKPKLYERIFSYIERIFCIPYKLYRSLRAVGIKETSKIIYKKLNSMMR